MNGRLPDPKKTSKLTIGQINKLLDEFCNLKVDGNKKRGSHNHEWREETQRNIEDFGDNNGEKQTITTLRVNWLQKFVSHKPSALEHKWLCRILLKNMVSTLVTNEKKSSLKNKNKMFEFYVNIH